MYRRVCRSLPSIVRPTLMHVLAATTQRIGGPSVHCNLGLNSWIGRLAVLTVVVALGAEAFGQDFIKKQDAIFQADVKPWIEQYCFDCHDANAAEADLDLEKTDTYLKLLSDREQWRHVLERIESGDMPPQDVDTIPEDTRNELTTTIKRLLNEFDCEELARPGAVTLRRLNRREYRNTIRDLTGVDYEPAEDFPGDDVGYGFDNIADVLSLPPLLLEKYLAAANAIAEEAIVAQPTKALDLVVSGADLENAKPLGGSKPGVGIMATQGTASYALTVPIPGRYSVTYRVYGHQAGGEPVKVRLQLDDDELREAQIRANEKRPIDLTSRIKLEPGEHQLSISFLNDFYDKNAPQGKQDRNLCIVQLAVVGPLEADTSSLPESHAKLVFVTPDKQTSVRDAATKVAQRLASRAFRRPATDEEIRKLVGLIQLAVDEGDSFEVGVQLALQAVLVSPHFLFRVEEPIPAGATERRLNQFELATALSYFFWSTMPDDQLLRVAWQGKLDDPKVLEQEVQRMLRSPKSDALVNNFAGQWLQLRLLDDLAPDPELFPSFDAELRDAMKTESLMLFESVMRDDLNLLTLLQADFTYVNEDLARHYGLDDVRGKRFQKVKLRGDQRGGLLTHASILTVTSNPTRTSPVKRGKWVLENLLGTPPPPPAPNVMELEDQSKLTGTLREKMQQHRTNPSCASCHAKMDPIGFALENYDAIGQWRDRDEGQPIDASGELPGGTAFRGSQQLQNILVAEQRDLFLKCLSEKMMTYALGRGLDFYDQCAIDAIQQRLANNDYRFSALVLAIVESDAFQKRSLNQGSVQP